MPLQNLEYDYINPYVADLANVVDMELLAASGLKLGVDPWEGRLSTSRKQPDQLKRHSFSMIKEPLTLTEIPSAVHNEPCPLTVMRLPSAGDLLIDA